MNKLWHVVLDSRVDNRIDRSVRATILRVPRPTAMQLVVRVSALRNGRARLGPALWRSRSQRTLSSSDLIALLK